MKQFFIQTFGCQMNVYDSIRITSMLIDTGWAKCDVVEDADLIILNTCSVREKATNKVFSALGRIRRKKKPDALFGIVGCVAREAGADAFRRIPELNFVLGPQSYHKLPTILENPDSRLLNIDLGGLEKFDELPRQKTSDTVAFIPIQEGCNHVCTYCIVPYTRGRELSRPFNDVMADTMNAINNGAMEIYFLGQNVNGYKFTDENGKLFTLADLIIETAKQESVHRIRFTSSYPTEMTDELIDLFRTEPKLMPLVHLPIQSGSADVLKRMNRPYSLELYKDIIDKLRIANPNIKISSDFIVGFPGETDADFEQTMEIVKYVGYVNSYSFKYSPRPHTAAALMTDQIPEKIKAARLKILDDYLNVLQREFNESFIDKIIPVMFESIDRTGNYLITRTPHGQQCLIPKPDFKLPPVINVKITSGNKSTLRGEIVID